MFRKSMRKVTAGLGLATLLAMSSPAAAAETIGRYDGGSLWAEVWAWIGTLWEKQGCTGPTAAGGEQGSPIDPNGPPCTACSGNMSAPPSSREEGSHIDPNGKP